MLDVIICANFGVEKLRGLGNTRGQIFEFSIEMASHLYNRAGATAHPVIIAAGWLYYVTVKVLVLALKQKPVYIAGHYLVIYSCSNSLHAASKVLKI